MQQQKANSEKLTDEEIKALDQYIPVIMLDGEPKRIVSERAMAKLIMKLNEIEAKLSYPPLLVTEEGMKITEIKPLNQLERPQVFANATLEAEEEPLWIQSVRQGAD